MTFTRRSDAATLAPLRVTTPLQQAREVPTVVRKLAQSEEVRVTYLEAGPRTGELVLLFNTYAEADAGAAFFTSRSLYEFDGVAASTSDYTIVADRIVKTSEASTGDYALVFAVAGVMPITGTPKLGWELRVPYTEVPE